MVLKLSIPSKLWVDWEVQKSIATTRAAEETESFVAVRTSGNPDAKIKIT